MTALGDNIEVKVLFLKTNLGVSPQIHPFGNKDHDKNLVIKVTTTSQEGGQKRSILLTGDANGTLLSSILYEKKNRELLEDIDCLVIPHHGSNDSGEFAWLNVKDFASGLRLLPDLLTLITSDPDASKSHVDVLPWPELQYFSYKRASFNQVLCRCSEHSITTRSRERVGGSWKCLSSFCSLPVFTTCSATQGFYRVIINQNGDMALYDGLFAEPLYYSFSPYFEQCIKDLFIVLAAEFEARLAGRRIDPVIRLPNADEILARVRGHYSSQYIYEQVFPSMPIFKAEWEFFLRQKGLLRNE